MIFASLYPDKEENNIVFAFSLSLSFAAGSRSYSTVPPHPGYFVSGIIDSDLSTIRAVVVNATDSLLARNRFPPNWGEGINRKARSLRYALNGDDNT